MSRVKDPLKVFILGAGSIGSLLAHDLKQQFAGSGVVKPIFLLRSYENSKENKIVKLRRLYDTAELTKSEVEISGRTEAVLGNETIDNLIITTKSFQTEVALQPYINRLSLTANILILQNGMGMADSLIGKFWQSSTLKPNIFEAITTHGVFKDQRGIVNHISRGVIKIGQQQQQQQQQQEQADDLPLLIRAILETPNLNAEYVPYEEFILLQMEKLIVNCCINPLTALYNVTNGHLLFGKEIVHIWRSIICECVDMFWLEYPILEKIPTARSFLNQNRLLDSVISVCRLTGSNSSSMRQDVRSLRNTEIGNINGHIAYLGRKHGKATFSNSMLTSLVKSKLSIDRGIEKAAAESIIDRAS
ncbi:PAN5 [Candida oxycetoniae]|uniref:2-dehydropantoate 2-reductase n=1 Tax=Candida oxycetoniae TaxID=497107 RepID=A0AAI9SXW0_9ASCO|nr:PAN5 [Candida oxycetoniae]KAI3404732.2 PAN5 [Candida oxycetoniae]